MTIRRRPFEMRSPYPYLRPMRFIRFFFAFAFTGLLVWLLQSPQQVGDKPLPALGAFFNPFSGFWRNAEPADAASRLPQAVKLPGLTGPVQVAYDDQLVPHIFAGNIEDAVRVQGYLLAQHRLWQMDLMTRKTSGRLSEILGERTLPIDRLSRRRGTGFAAENALKGWQKSPESIRLLEAYSAGVNAWMEQMTPAEYPLEFKLLGYKPEAWTPLKTALVYESMVETLCSRDEDLASTIALEQFGLETFDMLYPEWMPGQQPIIPDTGQWKNIRADIPDSTKPANADLSGVSEVDPTLSADRDLDGSNNWAVAGAKTRSGHPLLANDPHLSLSLPSIWFQVQIHLPEHNSYGVALPGVPGIIIGFNENIAWGMTNVGQDVSDWYKIAWADSAHSAYLLDGKTQPVEWRVEEIGIKGKPALRDSVRYTVWGPVVYDHLADHALRNCALRWISHDMPERNAFDLFLALNAGKSYADYQKGMANFDCPAQNFVFASRTGDIAIQVQGKFPIRKKDQGRFIQDGSQSANGWLGFIPQDQVPSMKNPSRGFVFSANQHSTPPSYPYYYCSPDFDDYRGRRIYDRLSAMSDVTVDSMKTIQLDNFSIRSGDALPAMISLLDRSKLDAEGTEMAAQLAAWNGSYEPGLLAPTLFEVWFDSLYRYTWDEMYTLREVKKDILLPDSWRLIDLMKNDPGNVFFDRTATPARETARNVVQESFQAMVTHFRQNPKEKTDWAHAKGFAIRHLALIDAFSRTDVLVGGNRNAPNAISKTHGPSWRMIVELSNPVRAVGVYPGGQSGNPGSRYYDNMVDTWAAGAYNELLLLSSPDAMPPARKLTQQTFSAQ